MSRNVCALGVWVKIGPSVSPVDSRREDMARPSTKFILDLYCLKRGIIQ